MNIRSLFSTLLLVLLASSFAFANSVSGWKPLLSANELDQILQAHSEAVTIIDIRPPMHLIQIVPTMPVISLVHSLHPMEIGGGLLRILVNSFLKAN